MLDAGRAARSAGLRPGLRRQRRLWATTGGGAAAGARPDDAGRSLNRYGDSLTQSLAFDAATGALLRLVGRRHRAVRHRSRAPSRTSATCASTTSPSRPTARCGAAAGRRAARCVSFDARGRAQAQVRLDADARLDRLRPRRHAARGAAVRLGTAARRPATAGASLYMVDLATLRVVAGRARRARRRAAARHAATAACWWPTAPRST